MSDLGEKIHYIMDSQENPRGKRYSRRDFLVDATEGVGRKEGKKGDGEGRAEEWGRKRVVDERSKGGDELLLKPRWCYHKLNVIRYRMGKEVRHHQ